MPRTIRACALSGVLLAMLCAAGCNKQTPETLVADAKAYHQKGDEKAAVIQLKNALQNAPGNAEARFLLGKIYNNTGDPASAEKELRRALEMGGKPADVKPELARSLILQGQYDKALAETEKAENNADLLALRGSALIGMGKYTEAQPVFAQALALQPDHAEALIGQAKVAMAGKDTEGAMKLADQSLAKNPQHVESWLFKGDVLRVQGKTEEALAAYEQSLKIQPDNSAARLVKANLEINSGKLVEARADIEAARKATPNGLGVMYTQALLEFTEEKYPAALESIQQVLRSTPDHVPSVLLAGSIQYALGNMQQAEQHFMKVVEKTPNNLYARKMLTSALSKNGQTQRALATINPALQGDVQDVQLLVLAGETELKAKNFAKSVAYFEKANVLAPNTANVHTGLGMAHIAQGDTAKGVAELEKAKAMGARSGESATMLVTTYMRMKQYDKALAVAKAMQQDDPKNPYPLNLQGGVYLTQGDKANARASFEQALALQPNYFVAVANLAQLDVAEKNPDAAKKRFEAVLQADKKNVQALVALANLASAGGHKEEARTWLERAVNDNPDSVLAARSLVRSYLEGGDKARALALATKLQRAKPGDTEALELLAQAQVQGGEVAAGLESYKKLAVLQPDSAALQFRIAGIHLGLKDEAAASAALARALELDPSNTEANVALANLEAKKGNYDAALTVARNLQTRQSGSPAGYILEGDVQTAKKNFAQAATVYEKALAQQSNGVTLMKLHGALAQTGKKKEADARMAKYVSDNPQDVEARMYLAQLALAGGQPKLAAEHFAIVAQADPKNVVALNNLAWAYQQDKDPRALQTAEQAYALAPDNPAVLDTVGTVLADNGELARAIPLLEKANKLAPQAIDTRYHLAQALAKSGDKVRARKELESVIGAGKTFAQLDDAKLLMKQL